MKKRVFYGKIVDGKIKLDDRTMLETYVSMQKDADIELELRPQSTDPTLRQWSYLYASVYTEFGRNFGWEIDAVDTWMKKKFMKDNGIVLPDGLTLTKTVFDRVWLAKYVDACIRYAAQEGVVVMPPKIGD